MWDLAMWQGTPGKRFQWRGRRLSSLLSTDNTDLLWSQAQVTSFRGACLSSSSLRLISCDIFWWKGIEGNWGQDYLLQHVDKK